MKFCGLSSGSGGNAWLFESGGKAILVDCGLSYKKLRERFDAVEFSPYKVQAVLISHAHGDHRQALRKFVSTHGCEVWCTGQTAEQIPWLVENPQLVSVMEFREQYEVAGFQVKALPVLHDSAGAATFSVASNGYKVAMALETGRITAEIANESLDADALLVEANHDPDMVAESVERYKQWRRFDPDKLDSCPKGAIPEDVGVFILTRHLRNDQAAKFISEVPTKARLAVLTHLSSDRNTPEKALSTVQAALLKAKRDMWVAVASQNEPTHWYDLQSLHVAETSAEGEWR